MRDKVSLNVEVEIFDSGIVVIRDERGFLAGNAVKEITLPKEGALKLARRILKELAE